MSVGEKHQESGVDVVQESWVPHDPIPAWPMAGAANGVESSTGSPGFAIRVARTVQGTSSNRLRVQLGTGTWLSGVPCCWEACHVLVSGMLWQWRPASHWNGVVWE